MLRKLKSKYEKDIALNLVLKDWVKHCIIDRKQENRRDELIETESKLKEMNMFLDWIKTQK